MQSQQPSAIRSDPEVVMAVLQERGDVQTVEGNEANAVESDQAPLRADPEITVARLKDRGDRILRQTFVNAPGVVAVLRDRFGGIEASKRIAAEHTRRQHGQGEDKTSADGVAQCGIS